MIFLNKAYRGYAAGTIVQLQTSMEAAAVAQGIGAANAGPVNPGAVTTDLTQGRLGISAGPSVVLTNPNITAETKFVAYLSQAAADATAFNIARIVPAVGSATFFLNAPSTGVVAIDWAIVMFAGEIATN